MGNKKDWLCASCKSILGKFEDESLVRIKRKDLVVACEAGRVETICPKCGKSNMISLDGSMIGYKNTAKLL